MNAFKDGNRPPGITPNEPYDAPADLPPSKLSGTGAKYLHEGCWLDPESDSDGRAAEYEKNLKEGKKV